MRDVIQKVLLTETEAKHRVQSASAEAERTVRDARKRAQELTDSARAAAHTQAQEILAKAANDSEKDKQARLAAATVEIETQIQLDEPARSQAVEAVLRCVCGGTEN